MRSRALAATLLTLAGLPAPALAWGRTGHAVVTDIARGYLTPRAAAVVDALLAADADTLTPPDLGARASWADAWRTDHRETTQWHFVNIDLYHPDLTQACFGFPDSAKPASAGPEKDCVVGRLDAFEKELADPRIAPAERLLAFKFVLHFVGDLHQPLHAADNQDRGGNCVPLALGGPRTVNLHSYWDTVAVEAIEPDPAKLAAKLAAEITPTDLKIWRKGDAKAWALESYAVARSAVYTIGSKPGCASDAAPIALPAGYDAAAQAAVALQLKKAGVRLALELNRALDPSSADEAREK